MRPEPAIGAVGGPPDGRGLRGDMGAVGEEPGANGVPVATIGVLARSSAESCAGNRSTLAVSDVGNDVVAGAPPGGTSMDVCLPVPIMARGER